MRLSVQYQKCSHVFWGTIFLADFGHFPGSKPTNVKKSIFKKAKNGALTSKIAVKPREVIFTKSVCWKLGQVLLATSFGEVRFFISDTPRQQFLKKKRSF